MKIELTKEQIREVIVDYLQDATEAECLAVAKLTVAFRHDVDATTIVRALMRQVVNSHCLPKNYFKS